MTHARLSRIIEHHFFNNVVVRIRLGVQVGNGVGAPLLVHAGDGEDVLEGALRPGVEIEHVPGLERESFEIEITDGLGKTEMLEAV